MNWKNLTSEDQIDTIIKESSNAPVVIFKHSTSCPISASAKERLESVEQPQGIDFYYLDLFTYRKVSNEVANRFAVEHESPQVLLIKNGSCIYNASHRAVNMEDIVAKI